MKENPTFTDLSNDVRPDCDIAHGCNANDDDANDVPGSEASEGYLAGKQAAPNPDLAPLSPARRPSLPLHPSIP